MRQKTIITKQKIITKLLQSVTEIYYKVRQALQSVTDCYYKVRQGLQSYFKVWQKSTTKCVRYYKVWQVLQSVTDCYYKVRKVLQSVSGIAKWDGYYTVRRNKGNFLCIAIDVHIL